MLKVVSFGYIEVHTESPVIMTAAERFPAHDIRILLIVSLNSLQCIWISNSAVWQMLDHNYSLCPRIANGHTLGYDFDAAGISNRPPQSSRGLAQVASTPFRIRIHMGRG
jgi:hypothetical protein